MNHCAPWSRERILSLFNQSFFDLLFQAQTIHRQHFSPNQIQISTLLSIKTGNCPEDCHYCPQSARYSTGIQTSNLIKMDRILDAANRAKEMGSTRFCMGAAWKNPKEKDMPYLEEIVTTVKALGLETCMTLGSLSSDQARRLAQAGLDYYNHNLDTSPEFYASVITTRTYQERLTTLDHVRRSGMKICSGGIVGLGEALTDRAGLLQQLANLNPPPESVPINLLIRTPGTPLEDNEPVDPFEFIKVIAVARIVMPTSYIRLSAGRTDMNEQTQALCMMAGANSIFYGCQLLTASNVEENQDKKLFDKLGIYPEKHQRDHDDDTLSDTLIHALLQEDTALFYNAVRED